MGRGITWTKDKKSKYRQVQTLCGNTQTLEHTCKLSYFNIALFYSTIYAIALMNDIKLVSLQGLSSANPIQQHQGCLPLPAELRTSPDLKTTNVWRLLRQNRPSESGAMLHLGIWVARPSRRSAPSHRELFVSALGPVTRAFSCSECKRLLSCFTSAVYPAVLRPWPTHSHSTQGVSTEQVLTFPSLKLIIWMRLCV